MLRCCKVHKDGGPGGGGGGTHVSNLKGKPILIGNYSRAGFLERFL